MGDDGAMAKGAGCTPEFRAKAVGLLTESRGSCSSETRAVDQVAGDPGVAPETLRRWSDKTGAAVAAETRQSAGDAMAELRGSRAEAARLGRVNGILTAAFTLGVLFFLIGSLFCTWSLLPLGLFCLLIFADSSIQNKSIKIGFLSIIASFIQLSGYGCGFLDAAWNRLVLKKEEFSAFQKTFYK